MEDARRLAIRRQLLDGREELPAGKEGVAQAIERIGYVQIDTISVVKRAHHQTLKARRPDYDPAMLHQLQAIDRRVFEYWGHAASYLPVADYRYYLPRMRRAPTTKRGRLWMEKNDDVVERVFRRIQREGPLSSKDFKHPSHERSGAWWDWKPSKMALDMLLTQGKLMVSERRNFQRVYDLTERVLPDGVNTRLPKDEDVRRFLVRRALDAYGIATEREIREHIHGMSLGETREVLAALLAEGEIIRGAVEGIDDLVVYVRRADVEALQQASVPSRCCLLCPFDNLIIQRDRVKWLFDFEYTLECYLPKNKRVWGYFVFPILFGDRLVGRLDPKADRKAETLFVRSLAFEPGFERIDELLPALSEELARLARFDGCTSVEFDKMSPTGHKRDLKRLVARALKQGS